MKKILKAKSSVLTSILRIESRETDEFNALLVKTYRDMVNRYNITFAINLKSNFKQTSEITSEEVEIELFGNEYIVHLEMEYVYEKSDDSVGYTGFDGYVMTDVIDLYELTEEGEEKVYLSEPLKKFLFSNIKQS